MVQGRGIAVARRHRMDALDLIKEDHKKLKTLLKETLEAEESQREPRMDHLRT